MTLVAFAAYFLPFLTAAAAANWLAARVRPTWWLLLPAAGVVLYVLLLLAIPFGGLITELPLFAATVSRAGALGPGGTAGRPSSCSRAARGWGFAPPHRSRTPAVFIAHTAVRPRMPPRGRTGRAAPCRAVG